MSEEIDKNLSLNANALNVSASQPFEDSECKYIKRKGATSIDKIPKEVMEQLNRGEIETVNLVEGLAIDQKTLLKTFLHKRNRNSYYEPVLKVIEELKKHTYNTLTETIGRELLHIALRKGDKELLSLISGDLSDIIRSWGTFYIANDSSLSFEQKLDRMRFFASDHHFGVREVAWLSLRLEITDNLEKGIELLSIWASDRDENIRRFASESTRPRGVWCKHIGKLKQNPKLGLPILEQLKADSSKYVQNSVGNWLNDAYKSQPDFVINLCYRWQKESPTEETAYIIQRALRNQ